MPKHRKKSSSRRSKDELESRRHYKHSRHSHDRSRSRASLRRSRSRSQTSSSSALPSRSSSRDRLRVILEEVRRLLPHLGTDHNPPQEVRLPVATLSPVADILAPQLSASEVSYEEPLVPPMDQGSVPGMSSCRPRSGLLLAKRGHNRCVPLLLSSLPVLSTDGAGPSSPRSVCFVDSPAPEPLPEPDAPTSAESEVPLVRELFGVAESPASAFIWNTTVLQSIQTESRSGLPEDLRSKLLTKYEAKGDLVGLAPPKLNRELLPALTPSVVKRDEYQSLLQAQVGAGLHAFGTAISILLKPEVSHALPTEAMSAITCLAEGLHLLADHHYRLSLTRRAFTKPSLNILGKNTAEGAPVDDFLFGKNFAENLKATQTCERVARDVSKAPFPVSVGKKPLQPIRRGTVSQPASSHRVRPPPSGNRRAPVRFDSARPTGAFHFKSHRPRSQSRPRAPRQH